MPNDGGHLILNEIERRNLLKDFPQADGIVRRLVGAKDFLHNKYRYCLWLGSLSPKEYKNSNFIKERINACKKYRLASTRPATRKLANFPNLFGEIRQKSDRFLIVPRHTSELREYVPFAYFDEGEIAHDSCSFIDDASLELFAIMSSKIHVSWLQYIGGKIKSDYRYSNKLVFNPFPWPEIGPSIVKKLGKTGQAILDARAEYQELSLADLYDPTFMPKKLRNAHIANDKAVDRLYRKKPFESERERVEHLFMLYEQLQAPVLAAAKPKPRKRKPRTVKTS